MGMIKELLALHKIQYIISVDDCYVDIDADEIKVTLFDSIITDSDRVEKIIEDLGKKEIFDEMKTMIQQGENADLLIGEFLDILSASELMAMYRVTDLGGKNEYLNDKDKIISLLNTLKKEDCIKDYMTFGSAKEAQEAECPRSLTDDEGLLWLIDEDLEKAEESKTAGLELAKTIIGRDSGPKNYVYILSGKKEDNGGNEEAIEEQLDAYLKHTCIKEESSFVYYLYKQRIIIDNLDKFAISLARGFKRKVCYELFDLYFKSLLSSIETSSEVLYRIRQETLNFLLDGELESQGESYMEFLARFVNIFQIDSYREMLSENHEKIAERIVYYRNLCHIATENIGDLKKETSTVKEFRKLELYDYYANNRHLEVSTGDIFKIDDRYYCLASQACDTCLRSDGKRLLEDATLLEICDSSDKPDFRYELRCFGDYKNPIINYHQSPRNYPFQILDLCVLSEDGHAGMPLEMLKGSSVEQIRLQFFTDGFRKRIEQITSELNNILKNQCILDSIFTYGGKRDVESEKEALEYVKLQKPELLEFKINSNELCYNVQRICRIDELFSVDILNDYCNYLSRIGHAFDFVKQKSVH